jgi:N-methylhydantoinase A
MAQAPGRAVRRVRVGIDTGGTFTDVVVLDETTGAVFATKTPSTPANPADGFMAGVRQAFELAGADAGTAAAISHGTTVATNQLLEDRIGALGFITTEGFEVLLEIARQSVPDGYGNSYFWVKPPRIVPAHRVRTVPGRMNHMGEEIKPFDRAAAERTARWFRDSGIDTIGVCFLHSYANPAHELAMRDVLRREHPGAVVSLSCEVLREYREYERSVTTLVDAAVKPTMIRYIAQISDRLATGAADGRIPFYVMKSNGGVLSGEEVVHQPITTVLSGPAAGALGAALVAEIAEVTARTAGYRGSALTLDGGGTSTDVAIILDGEPTLTTEGSVGRYPSKIPMIDIVTVGAGGGSLAWISPEGTLKVGPASAGADPGPLCYGKGGAPRPGRPAPQERATPARARGLGAPAVTDAHLFLGRIPPQLLGGEIPLDIEAAGRGLTDLAAELGMTPEECAAGILEISAWNQANAIRQITVKRGLDVRDYPMVAFGGSGPLLVCRLIDILGLPAVVVPRDPGNLSAFGLLTVDVKNDYVQTAVVRDADLDKERLAKAFAALETKAAAALDREGFARAEHRYARSADLRYYGQAFEVRVPAPAGPIDDGFRREVVRRFHDAHERQYGYCYRAADPSAGAPAGGRAQPSRQARHEVEWVNLRVSGIGPIRRPTIAKAPVRGTPLDRVPARRRPVCFEASARPGAAGSPAVGGAVWSDAVIHDRATLSPGDTIEGPAVIEEFGSTLPLHPGFVGRIDAYGNVIVTASAAGGAS